ncbi:MAG: hypothetical protein J7L71_07760 [Spirochaetaceae bacterium]|nr:hypothetical protein [Spirochaetaceae bacterium]
MKNLKIVPGIIVLMFITIMQSYGAETDKVITLDNLANVQKYFRSIHIMAMLLLGFGFLMVFVKKYGRTAITATYLLVALAIPLYFLKDSLGILGHASSDIDRIILAEFAGAGLLIATGAVLGRLKLSQYILLGLLFIPAYAFNEWLLLDGGFNIIAQGSFLDTGGSIVIHAFSAIFGFGTIFSLTSEKEYKTNIETDSTSDRFSLLGSMVLWVFWPSFCAALVPTELIPQTVVNVFIALSGSTLATYFASIIFRKKFSVTDIANATLAGGVAIGAASAFASPLSSFIIGALAGILSTFGFAVLQDKIQSKTKKTDSCGVLYLHGLPGLLGGFSVFFAVNEINVRSQLIGIVITIVVALLSGLLVGKIIALAGRVSIPYDDIENLEIEEVEN